MSVFLRICLISLYFVGGSISLSAQPENFLKYGDIQGIMDEIFDQHVKTHEMTPELVRRSFATYIDQFDPDRVYLLDSEVQDYIQLSDRDISQILNDYRRNLFPKYEQLHDLFRQSVIRSRNYRNELGKNKDQLFLQGHRYHDSNGSESLSFAKNAQDLVQNIKSNLIRFIDSERNRFGDSVVMKNKDSTLALYDKMMREHEDPYIFRDEYDNLLSAEERENIMVLYILKSLAKSLDAHTSYFDREEAYDMKMRLEKSFDGIGLILKSDGNRISVAKIIPNSPAAGNHRIQVDDQLLNINGQKVVGRSLEEVSELLRGKVGTRVHLILKRGNSQLRVSLNRETVAINEDRVESSFIPFGNGIIGKVTLYSFYQGKNDITSESDVRKAINDLKKHGNLRGLIIDMRENNGGFLNQAVKVAGMFISNGVVVISKYSDGRQRFYRDIDGKTYFDGPIVILTSYATASAAEIVAQALQDYGVAIVVGDEQTYGKGTIQSQTVTNNGSSSFFKVTVGKYYTVSGKTPQLSGVRADIVAPSHYIGADIGEGHLGNSITQDIIPSAYQDQFADVKRELRPWFIRYYKPTLQQQENAWKKILPTLKRNSEFRIAQNNEYRALLDKIQGNATEDYPYLSYDETVAAINRFQLQEAFNIVKDMITLEANAKGITKNQN